MQLRLYVYLHMNTQINFILTVHETRTTHNAFLFYQSSPITLLYFFSLTVYIKTKEILLLNNVALIAIHVLWKKLKLTYAYRKTNNTKFIINSSHFFLRVFIHFLVHIFVYICETIKSLNHDINLQVICFKGIFTG